MSTPQVRVLVNRAEESHQAAKVLLDKGFSNYSAVQSYYTMFYLTEALLFSKGCNFQATLLSWLHLEKSSQKPKSLTQNSIVVSSLQRDAARLVITGRKTQSRKRSRLSPFNGRKNSFRL